MTKTSEISRGLTRRWISRGPAVAGKSSLVDRILGARGMTDRSEIEAFMHPVMNHLHPPESIADLEKAAIRILESIDAGKTVAIYGDYDVDGITATAILFRLIRAIRPEARLLTYVPHRLDEGYGLNSEAIDSLAQDGASLVVSVDCGITAIEPARRARALGLDLIITDHHTPPQHENECPDAFAIVHPGLPWKPAPFTDLCGAGVAYKLAWKLATLACGSERVDKEIRRLLLDLLGLAAMGVVADVVPLVDENRVMTRWGLGRVKNSPFVGVRALVEASGLDGEDIDTESVGFRLAPRINACGRMGHARDAVELMLTEDQQRAREIADALVRVNRSRQETERSMVSQACDLAEQAGMTGADRRAIVLAHPDWHPGVVGIVCSRLVDRFARPTVLLQHQGEVCCGSGRSIASYNLHEGLSACAQFLDQFGGHTMAAGMRLQADNLSAFAESLITHANSKLTPNDLVRSIEYDCSAQLEELECAAVEALERLAPFGRDNPPVSLRVSGIRLNGEPKSMGNKAKHLQMQLVSQKSGRGVRAVAWNWSEYLERLPAGASVEAIVTPKLNHWRGRTTVEAVIQDIAIVDGASP